jgi:hypothetical protein
VLLQKQLPMHWYLQFLKYAADGLREETFDSLKIIKTSRIDIDPNTFTAPIPCDYVDWVKVGVENGQFIVPLAEQKGINRLSKYDSEGQRTLFGNPGGGENALWSDYTTVCFNDAGEFLGRQFGLGGSNLANTFKELPERGEFQLHEQLVATNDQIVLEYISDGTCPDNATQITPYAQKCLEAYIDWQYKKHSRSYGLGDEQVAEREFYNQRRKLRGRLNKISPSDLKRILNKNYRGSIKN